MAARKTTSRRPAKKQPCPECQDGQVLESFQVGGRRKRVSDDQQGALCLTCLGSGEAPTD
ncbi:hypothetical protein BN159_3218 [Streptomyces davaonensis JCM 4913]|uniref:Molecular chaperone DnaJ n=1 Tax=Streptomyces davaonensis (strain DSM 101723 / JCM 4913 / KCC S-0913 / 768) TaxID=1214101 RepID=K4R387_STRDJ|nr:hypothetical protein [Streptomyces davaonensis]CCK27597.1 hypothetical protein BN159_3218 [Streptomyces davaonensis JCM 4913]